MNKTVKIWQPLPREEVIKCLAAGNGIVSGTPFENIDAFLDEAVTYGSIHRQSFG